MEPMYIGVLATIGGVLLGALLGQLAGRFEERKRWERTLLERAGLTDRGERDRALSQALDKSDPMRHERLEQAIESIALEVERIAEGQRNVTRVLGERGLSKGLESARTLRPSTPVPVRSVTASSA
jgi:hypothetical protein